jgi:hypothetical protein
VHSESNAGADDGSQKRTRNGTVGACLTRDERSSNRRPNRAERAAGADSEQDAREVLDVAVAHSRGDAHAHERSRRTTDRLQHEGSGAIRFAAESGSIR